MIDKSINPMSLREKYNSVLRQFDAVEAEIQSQYLQFLEYETKWNFLAKELHEILKHIGNYTREEALMGFSPPMEKDCQKGVAHGK